MLQSMRQSTQSTAAKVIIGLIVLSFAAFGLETLLPGGAGTSVAEVNGEEITPFALQEAVTQQKRQLISVLGDDIDPAHGLKHGSKGSCWLVLKSDESRRKEGARWRLLQSRPKTAKQVQLLINGILKRLACFEPR